MNPWASWTNFCRPMQGRQQHLAHIALPANSLQGSSRYEKEFQKYTFATQWKDNIADK